MLLVDNPPSLVASTASIRQTRAVTDVMEAHSRVACFILSEAVAPYACAPMARKILLTAALEGSSSYQQLALV